MKKSAKEQLVAEINKYSNRKTCLARASNNNNKQINKTKKKKGERHTIINEAGDARTLREREIPSVIADFIAALWAATVKKRVPKNNPARRPH